MGGAIPDNNVMSETNKLKAAFPKAKLGTPVGKTDRLAKKKK
jgi:hypothetical protein